MSVRHRRRCFASSASVRVAHLPQKPVIDSFFIFVFTFPAKRQKRLPFLRQSASITHILFLYMAVSTCLTSISRKVPPSELPVAVTGISFLSAYLFALMYASAPEKFLHPSDSSSPDLSRPCRHYSCSPVGESHPTSVSYPCCCLSSIRQFVHKSTLLRTNCE